MHIRRTLLRLQAEVLQKILKVRTGVNSLILAFLRLYSRAFIHLTTCSVFPRIHSREQLCMKQDSTQITLFTEQEPGHDSRGWGLRQSKEKSRIWFLILLLFQVLYRKWKSFNSTDWNTLRLKYTLISWGWKSYFKRISIQTLATLTKHSTLRGFWEKKHGRILSFAF